MFYTLDKEWLKSRVVDITNIVTFSTVVNQREII